MTITKITEMNVVTKVVNILGNEFVLVSFEAQTDGQRETFGDTIYGLIPYENIDSDGYLKKMMNGYDMAIDGTPDGCIRNMAFTMKCRQWRAEHPNASDMEFCMWAATIEW